MRIALLLAVLVLASACDSQTPVRSPLELTPALDSLTRVDAGVLALRYTLAVEQDSTQIALDPGLVDALYRAIGQVRTSGYAGLVEGIHAFPTVMPTEVVVSTDTSVAWTDAWARGEAATGYAPVDRLVADLGFEVVSFREASWYNSAVLRRGEPLNTIALARQLSAAPDVRFADPNGFGGDGDDIRVERLDEGWRLDFSRGSGDCPAGCIERETWSFRVGAAGNVEYLGTS